MKRHLLVFIIFLFLACLLTWPLVIKINTYIPGFFSTNEPYGVLWGNWAIKYLFLHKLPLNLVPITAYPFGLEVHPVNYRSYAWIFWYNFLSILTNPAFAYNFQILLNFLLSAIFTYLLVFLITKNRSASVLAGMIFAFCPYQFARAWQHLGLTYNEWIPLSLYAAILLKEELSKKYLGLFLASLLLLASFNYCITYLGLVALLAFFVYSFFYDSKIKFFKQNNQLIKDFKYFKKVIMVGLIALCILSLQFIPTISNILQPSLKLPASGFNPSRRPFDDLFVYSARPLSYIFPAVVHPLFGGFTQRFIGSPYYGISFTEHTLYLGWTPFILAFIAFRKWRKSRRLTANRYTLYADENFYIGFFALLAIVAWFFSQPPWWRWGSLRIYMPAFFMYKILPMFRAYCRFGIVVMLAISVLAGFGLKFILERFKTQKTKLFITFLFCSLILFEFWNYPPFKVIDLTKYPKVYDWLKEAPGNIVIAEYPLDLTGPNEMYKFYQTIHHKRMINATQPNTYANAISQTLKDISDEATAGGLKWLGVNYAIIHTKDYKNDENFQEKEQMENIGRNKGLKLFKQIDDIAIYQVIAVPIKPSIK